MIDASNTFGFSTRACRAQTQPISFLMAQAVTNPDVISLAAGLVDYQTLPADQTRALLTDVLADDSAAQRALQYGTTEGLHALRQALLTHMAELDGLTPADLSATADDVIVSTGSQQLLQILTDILIDPGDIVITGWPSYFVYTGTLEAAGAEVRCVDMDEDGILPDALERLLAELDAAGHLPRVKIVYLVTYHQNPTGITLAEERRPAVLEIVRTYSRDHRILLLEDAAYRELTFEGRPPRSIKSWDKANEYVALVQTFSKPFAPGLKTGYGLLPRDLVEPVVLQKGNHDFGSVNFVQHLLLEAVQSGVYAEHVAKLCREYAAKCHATLGALEEFLGALASGAAGLPAGQTHWTHPSGGLYVWLTLPESIDTGRSGALFGKAIEQGVLYVPGAFCYGPDPTRTVPRNTLRLSYGVASPPDIREGIRRLAAAVGAVAGV